MGNNLPALDMETFASHLTHGSYCNFIIYYPNCYLSST